MDENTGESESLSISDDSFVPNGYIQCHLLHEELTEDCDAERVGVLDYMPLSRHTAFDVTQKTTPVALHCFRPKNRNLSPEESFDHITPAPHSNEPKNIELKTFRITECGANAAFRDQHHLALSSSCASDDDELLGAEVDDYLHEVVVQSSDKLLGDEPEFSGGVISGIGCIPSSFDSTRNAAWLRPNMGCESPSVDNAEVVSCDSEAVTCTTFRVSSHGCVATMENRDDEASRDQSLHHETSAIVVKDEKDPVVHLGSNSLLPVEVVSADRSPMDPSSISRSNVLYLNDYSLWSNAARAFCRDESASDRSEVEKRQERRDKRKERKGNKRTVKAEEIEGYIGTKEVGDLVKYIIGDDSKVKKNREALPSSGKKEMAKMIKKAKDPETSLTPVQRELSKSSETLQKKPAQKWKTNSENLGKTSTQSSSLEAENSSQSTKELSAKFSTMTINGSTLKSASKSDEPEQKLGSGSKKSKKHSKKNRNAQVADKNPLESWDNSKVVSVTLQSLTSPELLQHDVSTETFLRTSESGTPADNSMSLTSQLLSESRLCADAVSKDMSKPSSPQDKDGDWQVQSQKRPKNRAKQGDGENRTCSLGDQHGPVVIWKDQPSMPAPSYRKPEGSGPSGRVGSISSRNTGDGCQGRKFPHPLGSRGCQGSVNTFHSEISSSASKVGRHTFWGSKDSKENPKISNTPRNSAKFLNQGSSVNDIQSKRAESATYAGITAGVLGQLQCQSIEPVDVEKATPGQSSSKPDASDQVPSQIEVEADLPLQKMQNDLPADLTNDPNMKANLEAVPGQQSDGAGTADMSSKNDASTSGTGMVSTPEEQLKSDTSIVSTPMEQVRSDNTSSSDMASSSKELSRRDASNVGDVSSTSKQDEHFRVRDQGLSDVNTTVASAAVTETKVKDDKLTAEVTEMKTGAVSVDKDDASRKKSSQKTQSRVPGGKAKIGPVEFSKNFKGGKVVGISFGFDPTVMDNKSQGVSAFSDCTTSLIDDTFRSGGAISSCLVTGPSYSTTMVPAGGGISQGSGTAVGNCSRPIAPLSGLGHTSGAKTPVVVVNPMQLARGPTEPSPAIVGNDTDPEVLKEVMVPMDAVRINASTVTSAATSRGVRMVNTATSPVFHAKTDDVGRTMPGTTATKRLPATLTVDCTNILTKPWEPIESSTSTTTRASAVGSGGDRGLATAKRVTFAEGPGEHQDDALVAQAQGCGSSSEHQLQHSESVQHRPDVVSHQPSMDSGLQHDSRQHWPEPTHHQLSPGHQFQHEPQLNRPESVLHQPSTNAQLEVQQQQFMYQPVSQPLMAFGYIRPSQQGYILYSQPLLPASGYPQGMGPTTPIAVNSQQMVYQPQPRQGQHVARPPRADAPSPLLNAMINYHAEEFQKVLEEEKNDQTKVIRYKED